MKILIDEELDFNMSREMNGDEFLEVTTHRGDELSLHIDEKEMRKLFKTLKSRLY